ncbi:hypothetical protein PIB30_037197 [Stylosanthes scabra]|uniref:Uncharacterized protein n=1 Tax=Stylosanthes scabra TaxID=79078 RepID=A0ABU6XD99_9FABA|nr:hypothetical protein [Stylosanthes scabra]
MANLLRSRECPNTYQIYEKTYYEEDRVVEEPYGRLNNHHHHHNQPEVREQIQVLEYERVPKVIYEEIETDRVYSSNRHGHYSIAKQFYVSYPIAACNGFAAIFNNRRNNGRKTQNTMALHFAAS